MKHLVQVVAVIREDDGSIYIDEDIPARNFQVGDKPWQYKNRIAAVNAANDSLEINRHLDIDLAILVNGRLLNKNRIVFPTETVFD